MAEIGARAHRVIDEIMGNEALLEMLETEAATEMLNWGIAMATSLVERTGGLDDAAAEQALMPRLRAVRQSMRTIGNWAAGKYLDPESRVEMRDKLLEQFRAILGDDVHLPSTEKMDELLIEVDDRNKTPHQLILELRKVF